MTKRYFKVIDKKIIDAFKEISINRQNLYAEANAFGRSLNKTPLYVTGQDRIAIAGFQMSQEEWYRGDKENWTKPVNGCSKVKKSAKDKELLKKYYETVKNINPVSFMPLYDILGFNYLDLFPGSIGWSYKEGRDYALFSLSSAWPECSSIEAHELTGSEYELLKKS